MELMMLGKLQYMWQNQ